MEGIVKLERDKLRVLISPKVGGSIFSMEYNCDGEWVHIMRPTPISSLEESIPGDFSSFNMIPFSNRIENGLLKYRDRDYLLRINNPDGHTIHGEVRNRELVVEDEDALSITLGFDSMNFEGISWPFPFYSQVTYELGDENNLLIHMVLKNTGESTMPGGMGIHPYFMRRLTYKDDKVDLLMPIRGIYPGGGTIPTGHYVGVEERLDFSSGRELTDEFLDSCFALEDGDIQISWPESGIGVHMIVDSIFSHGIVYCPKDNTDFFAVEPVTNCNNAFNMAEMGIEDTGTIYIEPEGSIEGTIEIKVENLC